MGALAISSVINTVFGDKRVTFATLTPSATYATGGETGLTPAALGMATIDHIEARSLFKAGSPNTVLVPVPSLATSKLLLFGGSTAAAGALEEFGNGNDASGYSIRVMAIGD